MSLLGVCGWNSNQAGVKMSHISNWGTGTMTDPIVVNRDNPWLEGWYEAPPGRWMQASGTYSNAYSNSQLAGGFVRTYEFWEPSWSAVDDWQTPIRGDSLAGSSGYQTSSENGWLNWAVRSGNFVPGGLYAARAMAREMAARFRTYNEKIGRIRPGNPYTPSYAQREDPVLVASQNTCCETGGEKSWTLSTLCLGAGGEILPDAKCTDCCQISEYPPDAAFRPLGDCPVGQLLPTAQCDAVCCAVAGRAGPQYSKISRLACDSTPGATLVSMSYCGGPT